MDENIFDDIVGKVSKYKYTSMEYMDYETVKDFKVIKNDDNIILLYGYNYEAKMDEYHWAANDVSSLLNSIEYNKELLITFIPSEWVTKFNERGLTVFAKWNDYFKVSLDDVIVNNDYDIAKVDDSKEISQVTLECRGQSRGFTGQTEQWVEEWISNGEASNSESEAKDNAVIVYRDNASKIVGVLCTAIYGHNLEKGPIVWVREVAVNPKYQGQGIGRKLILAALSYGKRKGATRAFLHADECNVNAIHLYESIGFTTNKDYAQIDMWRNKG